MLLLLYAFSRAPRKINIIMRRRNLINATELSSCFYRWRFKRGCKHRFLLYQHCNNITNGIEKQKHGREKQQQCQPLGKMTSTWRAAGVFLQCTGRKRPLYGVAGKTRQNKRASLRHGGAGVCVARFGHLVCGSAHGGAENVQQAKLVANPPKQRAAKRQACGVTKRGINQHQRRRRTGKRNAVTRR